MTCILTHRLTWLQVLTTEARKIMWCLVVHNAGIMGAFLHCNLEDVNVTRSADAQHPEIFSGILVSAGSSQQEALGLDDFREGPAQQPGR